MLTEEIGKVCNRCYVLSRILQNQCVATTNVDGIVDESRHTSSAGFHNEFGNLQEHKIREHRECVQHHSDILKKFGM